MSSAIFGYDFTPVPLESHTTQGEGVRKQPRWSVVTAWACGKHHPRCLHADTIWSSNSDSCSRFCLWPRPLDQSLRWKQSRGAGNVTGRQVVVWLVGSKRWQYDCGGMEGGWGLTEEQIYGSFGSGQQIRGCVAEEMSGRWYCQPFKTSRNIKALSKIWLSTEYNSSLVCRGSQSCQIVTDTLSFAFVSAEKKTTHAPSWISQAKWRLGSFFRTGF